LQVSPLETAWVSGHYAIHGHLLLYQFKACIFLLLNNTNILSLTDCQILHSINEIVTVDEVPRGSHGHLAQFFVH